MRGFIVLKKHDEDEDETPEVHHHHHYHHPHHDHAVVHHPDVDPMGVVHHDHAVHHEHHPIMDEIHEHVVNPPASWAAYYGKPMGMMAIIEMEYAELMAMKTSGSQSGIREELIDLAAACICALKKM